MNAEVRMQNAEKGPNSTRNAECGTRKVQTSKLQRISAVAQKVLSSWGFDVTGWRDRTRDGSFTVANRERGFCRRKWLIPRIVAPIRAQK